MINKYLYPKWLEFLMGDEISNLNYRQVADKTFPGNTILKLAKPNGEQGEYIVKDCRGYLNDGQYSFIISSLNGGARVPLQIVYNDKMEFPIIKNQNDYEGVKPYRIILDINPEWLLQLSRLRLALAMSLNERLGENSLLSDVPQEIIECIGENIKTLVYDYSEEIKELEKIDKIWAENESGEKNGGGKRRPKKRKSKRKKTKRRKTKKRFRKYKKKGGERRSNYCMYKEPKGPGDKQERNETDCKDQEGCSWGIKLSPYYPIRGTKARCHKTKRRK